MGEIICIADEFIFFFTTIFLNKSLSYVLSEIWDFKEENEFFRKNNDKKRVKLALFPLISPPKNEIY